MMQKKTLAIALVWLLVASSIMMCAYAAADSTPLKTADQVLHPLAGCRCCNFIRVKGFIQCGTVCCVDGCCGRK